MIDDRDAGGGFVAALWCRAGSEWRIELEVDGDGGLLPPPLEPGTVLTDGWNWQTDAEVRA